MQTTKISSQGDATGGMVGRSPSEGVSLHGDRATARCQRICNFAYRPKFMCGLVHNGGALCGACRIRKPWSSWVGTPGAGTTL